MNKNEQNKTKQKQTRTKQPPPKKKTHLQYQSKMAINIFDNYMQEKEEKIIEKLSVGMHK